MDPNPFTFGPPPVPSSGLEWFQDNQFWTSQESAGGVPWEVKRSSPSDYYLQSPPYTGALVRMQSNATLQVCPDFRGGSMIVNFDASVKESNGQVFQVFVDGVVVTGGDIRSAVQNVELKVFLSRGNHLVNFVYTWTPTELNTLPTSTTGDVNIKTVSLPQIDPSFPTFSPTDQPSAKPSRSPSASPSESPTSTPSSSPTTPRPTSKPTVSPTLSPTVCIHVEKSVVSHIHIFV